MFEKDMKQAFLLDFYGDLLTERKRSVLDMYYNDDLSLAEVAEQIDMSRQGVRDIIKRAEAELAFFEEKLGLAERFGEIQQRTDKITALIDTANISDELRNEILELAKIVK